jgi:myosin-6
MEAGAKVYYPDPAEAYLVATVKHVAGLGADAELTLVPEKGGELKKVAKECSEADLKSLDGVPDMQQMDSLTEASLLGCLRVRYLKGEIYSAVGETLLAMNPFSDVSKLYTPAIMKAAHRGAARARARARDVGAPMTSSPPRNRRARCAASSTAPSPRTSRS